MWRSGKAWRRRARSIMAVGRGGDEDAPPFVNVFFELFFELGRDLFDMGTLSPYPWDLPRSGQQYGWWDSRNCPTLSALESALGSHPLRCPILCPSISSLTLLGAIISSPRPQQRCRAWPDRTTCRISASTSASPYYGPPSRARPAHDYARAGAARRSVASPWHLSAYCSATSDRAHCAAAHYTRSASQSLSACHFAWSPEPLPHSGAKPDNLDL